MNTGQFGASVCRTGVLPERQVAVHQARFDLRELVVPRPFFRAGDRRDPRRRRP
jgi:hypothetical protein